jgi:hypothetical protein
MAVTNFHWDEQNLLQERDDAGVTIAHYVTEPSQYGNVIRQRQSGQSNWFHFDAVGSAMELTTDEGVNADSRRYTAFGEVTEELGLGPFPFTFAGQVGCQSAG